jgi:hypothetical protein
VTEAGLGSHAGRHLFGAQLKKKLVAVEDCDPPRCAFIHGMSDLVDRQLRDLLRTQSLSLLATSFTAPWSALAHMSLADILATLALGKEDWQCLTPAPDEMDARGPGIVTSPSRRRRTCVRSAETLA